MFLPHIYKCNINIVIWFQVCAWCLVLGDDSLLPFRKNAEYKFERRELFLDRIP